MSQEGIIVSEYDLKLIKRYLCLEITEKLSLTIFIRHLRIFKLSSTDSLETNQNKTQNVLSAFEATQMTPDDLYTYFDINKKNKVYFEGIVTGLTKLDIKVDQFELKSFFENQTLTRDDYLNRSEFVSAIEFVKRNLTITETIDKDGVIWENRLGCKTNSFIKQNKIGVKCAIDLFSILDIEENGYLRQKELKKLINDKLKEDLSDQKISTLFSFISRRSDGRIYLIDFENWLTQSEEIDQVNSIKDKQLLFNRKSSDDSLNLILADKAVSYRAEKISKRVEEQNKTINRLTLELKQNRETIEFLEETQRHGEERLKTAEKDFKRVKAEYLSVKQKNDEKVNEGAMHAKNLALTDEPNKQELQQQKEINSVLFEENETLKLQVARLDDELIHLQKVTAKSNSGSQKSTNEVLMMTKYLNSKYEEGNFKKAIEKYKADIIAYGEEKYRLEQLIDQQRQKQLEFSFYLINLIKDLQEEVSRFTKHQINSFDDKELNKLFGDFDRLQKKVNELDCNNLALKEKLCEKTAKLDSIRVNTNNNKRIDKLSQIRSNTVLFQQIEGLIEENTGLKIKNIETEKKVILNDQKYDSIKNNVKLQQELKKKAENDLKLQLKAFHDREIYWTKRMSSMLRTSSQLERYSEELRESQSQFKEQKENIETNRYHSKPDKTEKQSDNLELLKLRHELQQLAQERDNLVDKVKGYQANQAISEIDQKYQNNRITSKMERQSNQLLNAAQNSIKLLQTVIKEKDLEIDELKSDIVDYRERTKSLQNDLNLRRAELDALRESTSKLSKAERLKERDQSDVFKKLEQRSDDYQTIVENYKKRVDFLEKQTGELEALNDELLAKVRALQTKNEQLLQENDDHTLISSLKAKIAKLSKEMTIKESTIDEYIIKTQQMEAKAEQQRQQAEQDAFLEESKTKDDVKWKVQLEMRIKLLKQKIETLKNKLGLSKKETERLTLRVKELESQFNKNEKQVEHYRELYIKSCKKKKISGNGKKSELNHTRMDKTLRFSQIKKDN